MLKPQGTQVLSFGKIFICFEMQRKCMKSYLITFFGVRFSDIICFLKKAFRVSGRNSKYVRTCALRTPVVKRTLHYVVIAVTVGFMIKSVVRDYF